MWAFFSRRLRTWLLITLVLPIAAGVLRRIGEALRGHKRTAAVGNGLVRVGDLGDRARDRLRGKGRRAA